MPSQAVKLEYGNTKSQTTSTKSQINHKFQVSRQKDGGQANSKQGLKLFFLFFCLLFVFSVTRSAGACAACWNLFVFCYLEFSLIHLFGLGPSGSLIINFVPAPFSDSTSIIPLCPSTFFLVIINPMPVPLVPLVL